MIPVWLMGFLINRYTVGGLLALGLIVGAYIKGYSAASQRCHEAELRAHIAALQRDMASWAAADEIERQLQADIEAQNADLHDKVKQYEIELAQRPAAAQCRLDGRDVERLRNIGKP